MDDLGFVPSKPDAMRPIVLAAMNAPMRMSAWIGLVYGIAASVMPRTNYGATTQSGWLVKV